MNVKQTIDDLPARKRNCSTCEYRGYDCPRMNKRYPHGFIKNACTGEISGMIACCPNYQGRY